ncbi:hypothetical protein M0R36_01060 [bacterium]|jgi:hypothetical protein|nr:hypothetical protein [bacterium]
MGLCNYYAIKTILSPECRKKGWKVKKDKIEKIENFFSEYVDHKTLIVIPRFNGNYISLRYCGLEILQVSKNGSLKRTLYKDVNGKIRRLKSPIKIDIDDDILKSLMPKIKEFIECRKFISEKKRNRLIPGFSPEHWLETLILADTKGGEAARKTLKIDENLSNVVSQVPVIRKPKKDSKSKSPRRRSDHIDLFGFDKSKHLGIPVIIELKKDNDLKMALVELKKYCEWYKGKLSDGDISRGNVIKMQEKFYLPEFKYNKLTNPRLVAVVTGHANGKRGEFEVVALPEKWSETTSGNPFEQ